MTKLFGFDLEEPYYNLKIGSDASIEDFIREENCTDIINDASSIKEKINSTSFLVGWIAEINSPEISEEPVVLRCLAKPVFYNNGVKWLLYHEKLGGYSVYSSSNISALYLQRFYVFYPEAE